MYKLSYAEIMEDDAQIARSREKLVFDRAIELMRLAEAKGVGSAEVNEAVQYVQRLWMFFIENLSDPQNELAEGLKDNLISIGRWSIAEADRIINNHQSSFSPLIDVNAAIRDGLS
jgi:flagellar protein FlaF